MARPRVVVFGGSGFLGSHVADSLSEKGFDVRLFDAQASTYRRADQEMILGDLMDLPSVVAAAKGCDYVYNFAAIADIGEASDHPLKTVAVNVVGNANALEAARIAGARRFLFASTVYVFSQDGCFYRASKQAAEHFVEAYQKKYGLEYTILRYGSLYGPRSDRRNAIHRLLKVAMETSVLKYEGSPEAVREYIHVSDAAKLSVDAIDERYKNRHLLLTGAEKMSVHSLLHMMAEMLPQGVKIEFNETEREGHYVRTPYSFLPTLGHKLVSSDYVDLGQGLLEMMGEIHASLFPETPMAPAGTKSETWQ